MDVDKKTLKDPLHYITTLAQQARQATSPEVDVTEKVLGAVRQTSKLDLAPYSIFSLSYSAVACLTACVGLLYLKDMYDPLFAFFHNALCLLP